MYLQVGGVTIKKDDLISYLKEMIHRENSPKKEFKVKFIESIAYALMSIVRKPFKVGLISYYPKHNQKSLNNGVAIHVYYLSRELAKIGLEVHIFAQDDKNYNKTEYIGDGKIVVHGIKTKIDLPNDDLVTKKRLSHFIFESAIIQKISKENSKESFDILHTHNIGVGGTFISKYFYNIPWIHTFHSVENNRLKFLSKEESRYLDIVRWTQSTINYSDAIITVSEILKKEVLQDYPLSEKVIYIPNGVDLELFNKENSNGNQSILHIGRFSLEKGVDLLPDIIKNVLDKNKKIKFVLVVSDKNIPLSLEKVKKKLEDLEKKHERFIWHRDIIGREEIKDLFKQSLIYIQPSRYEAFGLTVLEAMACGKAVIVSDIGGLSEVVENAGLIIPLKVDLFVKEILRLTEDFKLRERYGRRGFERAKLFSWEDVAKKTFELYKEIRK